MSIFDYLDFSNEGKLKRKFSKYFLLSKTEYSDFTWKTNNSGTLYLIKNEHDWECIYFYDDFISYIENGKLILLNVNHKYKCFNVKNINDVSIIINDPNDKLRCKK